LQAALAGFEGCELRHGARNLVFSDGNPEARVMIVGEAPGRDEDIQGKPFVGRAGQLLDAMLGHRPVAHRRGCIRTSVYITNMLPWRPPQNRDPTPEEISMLQPFVRRHVELAAPEVLILMGNWACFGLLGKRGITRMRGNWEEVLGRPALPMFHPPTCCATRRPSGRPGRTSCRSRRSWGVTMSRIDESRPSTRSASPSWPCRTRAACPRTRPATCWSSV
jgi:uracil-DNA glycosylase family 4